MFPTIEAGQEYTLNITASDAQGNIATASQAFSLSPQNMVSADPVHMMSVSKSLMDANDKPLALVKFRGSLTDGVRSHAARSPATSRCVVIRTSP
jgi:hypothetical protein